MRAKILKSIYQKRNIHEGYVPLTLLWLALKVTWIIRVWGGVNYTIVHFLKLRDNCIVIHNQRLHCWSEHRDL